MARTTRDNERFPDYLPQEFIEKCNQEYTEQIKQGINKMSLAEYIMFAYDWMFTTSIINN